ncbi:MAG: hypothetical protein ABI672_18115 [Vicinamibacteria bacterium]
MALSSAQKAEIRALVASGQKIEAIKRFREITGVGLKEALVAVTQMSAHAPQAAAPRGTHAPVASTREATSTLGPKTRLAAEAAALAALREGNVIEAIKRYRDQARVGLKEAKDAVDALSVVHASEGRVNAKLARSLIQLMAAGKKEEAIALVRSNVSFDEDEARAFLSKLKGFQKGTGSGCGGGCFRALFSLFLLVAVLLALIQGGCNILVRNSSLYECVEPKVLASTTAKARLGEPLALSSWMLIPRYDSESGSTSGDDESFLAYARLSGPVDEKGVWLRAERHNADAKATATLTLDDRDELIFSGSFTCPTR